MMVIEEQLEFDFEFGCPSIEAEYYREGAQDLIRRLVPLDLLEEGGGHLAGKRARFADILPLISWSELTKAPCALSVLLLCKYRLNACNFFCDMISRWLLPNKRVNVELFFASDVRLPHLSDELLSVAEIVINLKSVAEVEEVRRNLHAIETEIRLGVVSQYHARRILEFKGLSSDGKTAMIQEKISSLIQSHSKDFDRGIFSQMQQFLVTCPEDFKVCRDYHHISRIISNLHSLRKVLKQNRDVLPEKRHVILKLLKTQLKPLSKSEKERPVLGVLIGVNFLTEHEIFEAGQLVSCIQRYLPEIQLVAGSHFADRISDASQQTLYLEVEKVNGADFSLEEVQQLRTVLPEQIKGQVEHLTRPIFMPRNDEEVLKNIFSLSRQLRYAQDLSQVILSFDEQKGQDLIFTVILLRLIQEGEDSVQQLLAKGRSSLKYIPDRVRKVGSIRRKTKEATVFRTSVCISQFFRPDHTVDLYQARSHILAELKRILGDLRDYNGGMLVKQSEQIELLKRSVGKLTHEHPLLVEKFVYALMPMEMRTSLDIESLKQFFHLLLQSMKPNLRRKERDWFFKQDSKRAIAVLASATPSDKKQIQERIDTLSIAAHQMVSFFLEIGDISYAGYLFFSEEKRQQDLFLKQIF